MINENVTENTEIVVVGFPDPFSPSATDFVHRCALKDSLPAMEKHLEELNLDKYGRLCYQFSVLLVDEDWDHKLVYSYNGDKGIHISKGFEGTLIFDDGKTRLLPREQWLPYPGGRLVIHPIDKGGQTYDRVE